jgi:hypothetical protein
MKKRSAVFKPATVRKLVWVGLFCIAMGYLESAVVVYLRLLYYPNGFDFPLVMIPQSTLFIELGREAATVVMLVGIGFFCGRSPVQRFAYLILSFGIWDVFYYIWLKIFIDWPPSLLTWDILFLIPLPWVGPVLAPVLVSLAMMVAGLGMISREDHSRVLRFPFWAWAGEILAGMVIIISFIWCGTNMGSAGQPQAFHWELFSAGMLGGVALFIWRMKRQKVQKQW